MLNPVGLVVDKEGQLAGMITIKDIEKIKKFPNACKDSLGRLRAGAAVGVGPDMLERTQALLDAGADVIVIDPGALGDVSRLSDWLGRSPRPPTIVVSDDADRWMAADLVITGNPDAGNSRRPGRTPVLT